MKICDVVQFYSPIGGGIRRYILDKAHHLSQRECVEHVVLIPSHRNALEFHERSKFYQIHSVKIPGSLSYRALLNRERILNIIHREQPDIIEVGDPYRPAWICLQAKRRWGIPVVAFYHSDFPRALGRTIHKYLGHRIENCLAPKIEAYVINLYNRMDATIVASRRLETLLTDIGIQRVVRIPLGTNVDVFCPSGEPEEIRRQLGLASPTRLLLFVGRLAREKNIRSLIGMMDHLNSNASAKYHLLLVGDGEQRRLVQQIITRRHDITWYQFCNSAEELARYYTAADLFVHAGCFETFGITGLEAQACGTPVLAVEGGGMEDTVAGEDPLVMAKSSRPSDLAEGVERILATQPNRRRQARRRRIATHFSIQNTFDQMLALYSHLRQNKSVKEFPREKTQYASESIYYPAILTG